MQFLKFSVVFFVRRKCLWALSGFGADFMKMFIKLFKKLSNQLRMYSPQAIQHVDEFISSSEQIWRNVSLYISCSPMDHLQWMGAVRKRVQTADKNITIIHTPVYLLTSFEVKRFVFLISKSTIRCFNFKHIPFGQNIHDVLLQWKSPTPVVLSHQNPQT